MLYKPLPIKWGIQNEKLVYVQYMRQAGHSNLVVKDCGFVVSLSKGWLGASLHSANAYTLRLIRNYVIILVMLNYESIR